jgi:hypothetical protein
VDPEGGSEPIGAGVRVVVSSRGRRHSLLIYGRLQFGDGVGTVAEEARAWGHAVVRRLYHARAEVRVSIA